MDAHTRTNGSEPYPDVTAPADPSRWPEVDGYDVHALARSTATTDVYLAHHRPTGTNRELTVVRRTAGVDQAALREAVDAEVAAVRALPHAGIAPVEDVGLTRDGRLYIATARPVGPTLDELLQRDGRFSVRRAFDLGLAVVTAVGMAHERGLIHGRLAADSIVVVPPHAGWPERPLVLGFGTLAAQSAGLAPGALSEDPSPYVSPERAAGAPPSPRTDVFALGTLILHMLTGSTPLVVRAPGPSAMQPAADPAATHDPGDIEHVLRRARDADPARRYASARELGAALWAVNNAWFEAPAESRAVDARGPGRHQALVAAGVVGVVAAATGALVWRGRMAPAVDAHTVALGRQTRSTPNAQLAASATSLPVMPSSAATPASASVPGTADSEFTRLETSSATSPGNASRSAVARSAPRVPVSSHGAEQVANQQVANQSTVASDAVTPGPAMPGAALPAPAPASSTPRSPASVTSTSAGDVATTPAHETPAATPTATGAPNGAPTEAVIGDATTEAARGYRAAEVLAVVADYASAIGARDLDRLQRLYPTMPERQRSGWTAFFNSITDLHAPVTVEQISVTGPTARVRARATYEYENLRPHRAERSAVTYQITLVRDGTGWRIRSVE